jgi:hypothetical protein
MRTALLTLVLTLSLVACGKNSAKPADRPPVAEKKPEPPTSAAKAVVIKHGKMTYVMDTPEGQLDKARSQIEGSDLVAKIAALGVTVTYEPDPNLDDTVVVSAEGKELGRTELRELDGSPDMLVAAVKAHFQLTP